VTAAHLALTPRDGVFCLDGRGWHTSASGRGHGLDWPWPSTLLGALRTAWGRGEEARRARRFTREDWRAETAAIALGRTLVLRRGPGQPWADANRVWPVPSDARWLEGETELRRLDPTPPRLATLGRDDDPAREALWVAELDERAKPHRGSRWWCEARFTAWLAGRSVPARDPASELDLSRRVQAHVGIRGDVGTADDGVLFSHDVVETLERSAEWALGVEVEVPRPDLPPVATLGSDSRLVKIEALAASMFAPPAAVVEAFDTPKRGLRLVVVTPACFGGGWIPDGIERRGRELRGRIAGFDADLVLRAALVDRPVNVSGWDIAAGKPKSAASMVPPGAVYFFERADGQRFGRPDANALWLAAIGARSGEGFGRVVPGTWNPASSVRSEG
jgi:CRISPR-associated protein Cmr3